MRNWRPGRGLTAVLTGCLLVGTLTGPAIAGPLTSRPPAGGFKSWSDLLATQQKMVAAANRIRTADAVGYAGIVAAPENHELRVYWKGPIPTAIAKLADRQDVPVRFLPAAYTERELLAEADRLRQQPSVAAVGPTPDGSGLEVSTKDEKELAAVTSSVPLTRTLADPTLTSREYDTRPYWGGAEWNNCSTGFAVMADNRPHMLSAGHCGNPGDGAFTGPRVYMGQVTRVNKGGDWLLIDAPSAGRVYDGVGANWFSKPVVGADYSYAGNWVCTSGAYSGAVCEIQVTAINRGINVRGHWVSQLVVAEQVNHTGAAGSGDSGGPVFDLTPDWRGDIAKGTITALDGSTQVPCQGKPASDTRVCGWRIYYASVPFGLEAFRATIITSPVTSLNRAGDGKKE